MIKRISLSASLIVFTICVIACANIKIDSQQEKNTMTSKTIEQVLKDHTSELLLIPGVVGTAQGLCNKRPCIKVFVIKKTHEMNGKIPNMLEGYTVMIEETGEIRALPENQN